MSRWKWLLFVLLGIFIFAPQAFAIEVSSPSSDWVLLPNSIGPDSGTWGLPAQTQYGYENEPSYEQPGVFNFSQAITSGLANYYILESDNMTVSDTVVVTNSNGLGQITFTSDPTVSISDLTGWTNLGTEDDIEGFVGPLAGLTTTDGKEIAVAVASDGETVYDPFGYGYDTSDQIKFEGVTPNNPAPEPTTLLLLGTGLVGLAGLGRKKFMKS